MKPPAPGVISAVRPGSLADEAGIAAGDSVVSIDGRILRDVVDYQFYQAEPEITVHIRKAIGLDDLIVFEKDMDEDLGLEFERATWDDVTLCNNNCFFCFLKGLPKGMRKTLYMKDDDYRLSFLHGNFVTLTNLTEDDWARLDEQRLSPLNVSVHATDLALRRRMLSNPTAPDILDQLRRLGSMGLAANTQIVLCPGVNDGAELTRSLTDLIALYPAVESVSVVPVGASPKLEAWSSERDGVELIRPTREQSRRVVAQVLEAQRAARDATGHAIVHCSDEFYVTAGVQVPGAPAYEGYPQYENGIGMVRAMLQDWYGTRRKLQRLRRQPLAVEHAVIGCGALIAPRLATIAAEVEQLTGARVEVRPVTNTIFGERVNVSGLLCARDFIDQLKDANADCYILPRPSLDYFGEKHLDSIGPDELEHRIGAPVAYASQFSEVVEILHHGPRRPDRAHATNGVFWSEPHATAPASVA